MSPYVFICDSPQEIMLKFPMKGQHKICKYVKSDEIMIIMITGFSDASYLCHHGLARLVLSGYMEFRKPCDKSNRLVMVVVTFLM